MLPVSGLSFMSIKICSVLFCFFTSRLLILSPAIAILATADNLSKDKTSGLAPEVIKLFSCSSQLSTKFQLLIKTKIPTNEEVSCFKSLRCCIYHADKC